MQPDSRLEAIKTALNTIQEFDEKKALTQPRWGDLNFSQSEELIVRIKKTALLWQNMDLTYIPEQHREGIKLEFERIEKTFSSINEFKIDDNARKLRDSINNRLNLSLNTILDFSCKFVPFIYSLNENIYSYTGTLEKNLKKLNADVLVTSNIIKEKEKDIESIIKGSREEIEEQKKSYDGLQRQFKEKTAKADKHINEFITQSEHKLSEVDEKVQAVLKDARDFAAKMAIAPYTHAFEDTSKLHKTASERWLYATLLCLFLTGIWAYVGLTGSAPSLSNQAEIIYFFSTRGLVTGLLVSSIWWSAKQYRVSMHQRTVNQHKADALKSFEAFIEATTAPDIRDSVILQTSQAIFGQEQTGYLDKQGNDSFEKYAQVAQSVNNATKIASKT